jgi:cob(I)alamin adenosyltransferase
MEETGRVHVFTGEGKGKTTAAVGLAWRAIGRGLKVFMVQFLKAPDTSGEQLAAKAFEPMFTIKPMGRKGFIRGRGGDPLDKALATSALGEARTAMLSGGYDLVILDEINVAVKLGLVAVEDVLNFMDARPDAVEIVLTGRDAHPDVIQRADSVLEMKKIKHPFDQGVAARKGIEF